ncbi:Major facilitator superfamily domain, general substrate transporter [Penicillium expansum]|uniref:Major facilitator superfamily domain, general substrate transporter n=1 Tax=Penicillium expansum TaxID=27334 RepID=A0A0A2J9X6_PENEN|nr:Major facilitator superfamily domain, general substrate transporter [Penicillium expansum]KGO41718.1 Major facilitator superfamily domain, general substrate transporter [Penicillium expansum]KGO52139.1 Major facilitator superfamily domain, general substrate transporter [Penicillium expansum]KGO62520.1 Major facilitator superfamily domain, general substrate transporter [Penicillium expansum]
MRFPPKVYQFLVGTFAALGSFLYGYDLTIVAEVVSSGSFLNYFSPTTSEIGLVASLLTAGAFVGAGLAYPCSDHFGRRATILTGGLIFCLGGGLQTGAQNYGYILGGRFISGVSIGVLTMIIPIYQAELVHPDIRGLVTGLQQFMVGIGGVCGSWISYGTYVSFSDNRQWRIPLGIQIVPAALLSSLIFFFPESPRWLISQGQQERGLQTLARLHANGNTSDPWILAEFEQIKAQIATENEHSQVTLYQSISDKSNFRRILLACAMQAATQMTGVSAIQYYSVTIFKQIGIDGTDTLRYQAINSIIGLIGELLLMLIVDKIGRRKLVVGGNLAMCLTYVISTILLAQFPPEMNNAGAHWGFVIMTWVYNFCFASMGSLSWMIPAEIFDTATRAKGVALGCMVSFAFNTMIGQVTPIGMATSGWKFYILFVVCNFTNAVFFWAMLPETKQLPLEEMKKLFTETPWFVGNRTTSDHRITETSMLAERIKEQGLGNKNGMAEHEEFTA